MSENFSIERDSRSLAPSPYPARSAAAELLELHTSVRIELLSGDLPPLRVRLDGAQKLAREALLDGHGIAEGVGEHVKRAVIAALEEQARGERRVR